MYIGSCYEGHIEGEFVFSPFSEMLGSLHVLCEASHHLNRLEWAERVKERIEPELLERIITLGKKTNDWCIIMDFDQVAIYEEIDILDKLIKIEKLSILKWNRIFKVYNKKITLQEKEEIIHLLKEYYFVYFQEEIKLLQPFILYRLKKELAICREEGLSQYVEKLHERIEVQEDTIICHKYKDYRIERSAIDKIQITATTFMNPHLLLGVFDRKISLTKMITVERKKEKAPEDLVKILKALGDDMRLQILKELKYKAQSTQELSQKLKITEAGISKHLKLLYEAEIVTKERKGNFIYYGLKGNKINEVPYRIFEYMM